MAEKFGIVTGASTGIGFELAHIVSGWKNKVQAAAAHVTPASTLAEQHRKIAEPGTAKD